MEAELLLHGFSITSCLPEQLQMSLLVILTHHRQLKS
jgi:hypothetical protein